MNRYIVFFNREGYLACKKVTPEKEVSYVEDGRVFMDKVHEFINGNYRVKIKDNDVLLVGSHEKLVLKNFELVKQEPHLQALVADIMKTVQEEGFVDLSKKDHLKQKPNRVKSNAVLPRFVKAGLTLVAGAGIVAALYTGASVIDRTEIKETPQAPTPVAIVQEVAQVQKEIDQAKEDFIQEVIEVQREASQNKEDFIKESAEKALLKVQEETAVKPVYLEFENNSQSDKAINARDLYMPYFEDCAHRFGLDANLLLAIGTQERGVHNDVKDKGGGLGLMQVQYDVWIDKTITYYELNDATLEFEKKSLVITDDLLKDVKSNIEIGSMILQNYLMIAHYNVPAAIQMYNMGNGAVKSIMRTYAEVVGKDFEEVLEDPFDLGWLEYRYLKRGDKHYLENVNQWSIDPTYTVTNLNTLEDVSFAFTNEMENTIRL